MTNRNTHRPRLIIRYESYIQDQYDPDNKSNQPKVDKDGNVTNFVHTKPACVMRLPGTIKYNLNELLRIWFSGTERTCVYSGYDWVQYTRNNKLAWRKLGVWLWDNRLNQFKQFEQIRSYKDNRVFVPEQNVISTLPKTDIRAIAICKTMLTSKYNSPNV